MWQTLVITDVTQMKEADRVCVVGINQDAQCIRPVDEIRERGIPQDLLFCGRSTVPRNSPIIYPGARVWVDLNFIPIRPPHIEDRGFDAATLAGDGRCADEEWETILRAASFETVQAMFDCLVKESKWVKPGARTRSIGTLIFPRLGEMELSENSVKPRLAFNDTLGHRYKLPVSDLALWRHCYSAVKRLGKAPQEVLDELGDAVRKTKRQYLRIGLARPWKHEESNQTRCYLQVTGLYTFPDYLDGKNWADF
ncbi:MAG: hypothetical protein HY673_11030 [Chloroflexi bacterium]|nr:hypothetical protein [Chloroflexota bacterium]